MKHLVIMQQRARLRKALWIKACRHDGVEPTEIFVVFSDDNPHKKRLNELGR